LAYEQLPGYTVDETNAIYSDIMGVLCDPGYMGDMFQATSSNDVTFWLIHPNLERVWHVIRLNVFNGVSERVSYVLVWLVTLCCATGKLVDFDDTWPDSDVSCTGHYSTDAQPFKGIFNYGVNSARKVKRRRRRLMTGMDDDDSTVATVNTNLELYDLLNPTQDEYPYIFDNFDWTHCKFLGKLKLACASSVHFCNVRIDLFCRV
jgi:hypothetical protein